MAHKITLSSVVVLGAVFIGVGVVGATPSTPAAQVPATTPVAPAGSTTTIVVVTGQAATDTPETKGGNDMNRVICRTRPVLGSRLSKQRECRTAAQWELLRRQASSGADGATRSMTKGMVRPGS
jgi:hypothetical protein